MFIITVNIVHTYCGILYIAQINIFSYYLFYIHFFFVVINLLHKPL